MTKIASNLQIDSARLWDAIHETAKFGATPKGGVRRLTLGPEDKQVRDWFRNACEAAGLERCSRVRTAARHRISGTEHPAHKHGVNTAWSADIYG